MVFRKPYAFLIKNFKLMHIILTICCAYLILKTSAIISFLGDYISSTDLVIGQEIVSNLYSSWMFIIPVLMLLFFIVLLTVMVVKEKPKTFYVVNILVYFLILILFIYGRGILAEMEKEIVQPQKLKSLYDLFVYALIFQVFTSVIAAIRGFGFDIKKFDFSKDLQQLDVSEEDNEEFEISINYDFDDTKRRFKKKVRNFKYVYAEHKFIINIVIVAVILFSGFLVYKNTSISIKKYNNNSTFTMNSCSNNVLATYLVNTDSNGVKLDTNLLVISMNVRTNNKYNKKLVTGAYELVINGKKYHHHPEYAKELRDIGNVYANQDLDLKEYTNYLLVYDIGKSRGKNAQLKITNLINQDYVLVNLKITNLTADKKVTDYKLKDEIKFDDTYLLDTSFKINDYEISDKFTLKYNYCVNEECIESIEYLVPDYFNTNVDKTILRMNYKYSSKSLNSFYKLINLYGKLEYKIDNVTKVQNVAFKEVKSNRVADKNILNLEVVKEVEKAEEIYLVFNIRNSEYRYKIK